MKKLCLLVVLVLAMAGSGWAQEEYPLGPDSQRQPGGPKLPPGNSGHWNRVGVAQDAGGFRATGIALSPDQSLLFTSDPASKWVWSYQVQADGSISNGEAFFRLETLDESSESGAAGMATDSGGLLYVATKMGIQICDQQGRVVAILNLPEQAKAGDAVSRVAFGGPDHQYLYAIVGHDAYRRQMVKRSGQP